MGQLVFQATAGGQVALVGPNPSTNFSLNVPAVNGNLVTTGDTGTVTNTMLAASAYNTPGAIGSGTANTGAFTTLSASSTVSGTGFSTYLASPPAIGGTTPSTGKFTTITGTLDASISGLTVGKGGGSVSTNTALGFSALAVNTSGSRNLGAGAYSLYVNTTGASNTGLGVGALFANTTGSYNTSIGDQSLISNTTASNNTAVGYQAGYSNTTGTQNVLIGRAAGYTSTASYCTFVGDYAGQAATIGNSNTFIGAGAGSAVTTGLKHTILGGYSGNQGGLDIRTASNYIVLSDGDGNPRGVFDSSGNFITAGAISTGGSISGGFSVLGNSAASYLNVGHITGTASGSAFANFWYNGGAIGSITQSGTTAVLYNLTSDRRIKENIIDAPDASSDIDAIQVRSFDYISDKSTVKYGFIAQELVTVAPDAVHQPSNPDEMMGVDYSKLVPMMLKEIQSLRKRIATLEAK